MSSLDGIKMCAGRQELFWQTGSKLGLPWSHCHIIFISVGPPEMPCAGGCGGKQGLPVPTSY